MVFDDLNMCYIARFSKHPRIFTTDFTTNGIKLCRVMTGYFLQ